MLARPVVRLRQRDADPRRELDLLGSPLVKVAGDLVLQSPDRLVGPAQADQALRELQLAFLIIRLVLGLRDQLFVRDERAVVLFRFEIEAADLR